MPGWQKKKDGNARSISISFYCHRVALGSHPKVLLTSPLYTAVIHPIHAAASTQRCFFSGCCSVGFQSHEAMQSNGEKTVQARRRRRRWSEWSAPPPILNPVFSNNSPVPQPVPVSHCSHIHSSAPVCWKFCQFFLCQGWFRCQYWRC